jgi:predicted amidohydrolase YtcJ
MVLNSIEALESDDRPQNQRIEHAELLRDDQIERIARMKISLAMQPVFEKLWGGPERLYSRRLGERWRQTNRFRDLIDAGAIIAGSSDSYITPIDPLDGVIAAVNHPNPAQRVSLSEGIAMFSSMAARSEMLFDDRGSIQIGKSADFVVVSGDLDKRENISIEATIIGGEIVFEKERESDE